MTATCTSTDGSPGRGAYAAYSYEISIRHPLRVSRPLRRGPCPGPGHRPGAGNAGLSGLRTAHTRGGGGHGALPGEAGGIPGGGLRQPPGAHHLQHPQAPGPCPRKTDHRQPAGRLPGRRDQGDLSGPGVSGGAVRPAPVPVPHAPLFGEPGLQRNQQHLLRPVCPAPALPRLCAGGRSARYEEGGHPHRH